MRLILTRDYVVDIDALNWTVRKIEQVDTREWRGKQVEAHEKETLVGYYSSFEQAVQGLLKHKRDTLKEEDVLTLEQYVVLINEVNAEAVKQFSRLGSWVKPQLEGMER